MRPEKHVLRVGVTVIVALAVLATGIVLVGERRFLFNATNRYFVRLANVNGLAQGNPVQLNGVNVGRVERIFLPQEMEEELLEVWITVDRRYAKRVRGDSLAGIKTLGLLGDKYVAVTSGSPASPEITPDGEIPAAPATDVDQLIASGEDVVENILSVAHSLANILARMERGEGLLGGLLSDQGEGQSLTDSMAETLASIQKVAESIEEGQGPLGRLIHDEEMADRMSQSLDRLDTLLAQMEGGDGLLPSLINDGATREKFDSTLDELTSTLENLSGATAALKDGDGLLPRLLNDSEYADQVSKDLQELLNRLNLAADQLTSGEGTVSQLMNDPQVYEALNDILVGINESRFLRWLIRNRQKAGIKKRYRDEVENQSTSEPENPSD